MVFPGEEFQLALFNWDEGPLSFSGSIPLQDFYNDFFVEGYRTQRFHEIAKNKGIPSALVSQSLKEKKAFW